MNQLDVFKKIIGIIDALFTDLALYVGVLAMINLTVKIYHMKDYPAFVLMIIFTIQYISFIWKMIKDKI